MPVQTPPAPAGKTVPNPGIKPVPIKSLQEIPDSVFEGKASPKKPMAEFFGGDKKDESKETPKPAVENAPGGDSEVRNGDPEPAEQEAGKVEASKEDAPPEPDEPAKPSAEEKHAKLPGGQLREKLEAELRKNRELSAKLAEAERLREAAAEAETLKKVNRELEETVKWADFTKSREYKETYEKPLETAIVAANKLISRIRVDGEDRVGKPEDIKLLYNQWIQDPAKAVATSQELFGNLAPTVMAHVQAVADANERASGAAEQWKAQAETRRQREEEEGRQRIERLAKAWTDEVASVKKARPDLFDFEGDPELKPLFDKYERFAEKAFLGDPEKTPDEILKIQARVRNYAAAYGPTVTKLKKAEARIAELEQQVAEFSESNPNIRPTTGEVQKGAPKTSMDALRKYVK